MPSKLTCGAYSGHSTFCLLWLNKIYRGTASFAATTKPVPTRDGRVARLVSTNEVAGGLKNAAGSGCWVVGFIPTRLRQCPCWQRYIALLCLALRTFFSHISLGPCGPLAVWRFTTRSDVDYETGDMSSCVGTLFCRIICWSFQSCSLLRDLPAMPMTSTTPALARALRITSYTFTSLRHPTLQQLSH